MECYICGAALSRSEFCDSCGADVRLYKKILKSSDVYYNQGLARAQERDLTGAAECLRQSVKLNKHNTKARNLLGLVYFEMGEAVAAISQWVISENLQPEKNLAETYLNAIQRNAGRLETINQTIKKYNQALIYARQDSPDLAIIQLKKVLNLNSNLVKGHQLLALLYMKGGENEKALKCLRKALAIDKSNPLTLKYLKEIKGVPDISPKKAERENIEKTKTRQTTADEVIIPKNSYKESNSGGITVLNVIIGIALGAALMWFLVLPAKEKTLADENNQKQMEISEQLEQKNSSIVALEGEKAALEAEKQALQAELEAYGQKDIIISVYEGMLRSVNSYLNQDFLTAAKEVTELDQAVVQSDIFTEVYNKIRVEAGNQAADALYEEGYRAYTVGDYNVAKERLEQAYALNPDDTAIVYYLGRAYQRSGDAEKGREYLQIIIDRRTNDSYYDNARRYIN